MWTIARTHLIALALAGFIGQTTAHATPVQVFQATGVMDGVEDCAEMAGMGGVEREQPGNPCENMTPECIAKMGCAAVAPPILPRLMISRPAAHRPATYSSIDVSRDGVTSSPLVFPPKQQA